MREEDNYPPEKPNMQKVGILLLILLVVMMIWFIDLSQFFADKEDEFDCDPEFENCEDKLNIIVRFIGNYEQLLTYT